MNVKLEILHLRMLRAITETGSVTRAAGQLGITQSALSHRLRDAESRLSAPLFERKNKKLILTDTGKRLLFSADIILNELENVEHQISTSSLQHSEAARIGMKAYGSYHWLPAVITGFRESNPGIEIELSAEVIDDPLQALQNNTIDLAVISHPFNDDDYESIKLFEDEMVAVLPKAHPKAALDYLEVEDFSLETYITHETTPEKGREYDLFFSHAPARLEKIIRIDRTDAIVELVDAGLGVTILTRWILEPYLKSHHIITKPLTKNRLFVDWHAVIHKEKSSTSVINLANEIKKHTQ